MSSTLRLVLALAVVGTSLAACAQKQAEEVVYVEPVTTEPVYTGKYK